MGRDPPDLKQLSYLPAEAEESGRLRVVRHDVPGHTLGAGLKAAGLLRKTVLGDLLGHSYQLPAAGEPCACRIAMPAAGSVSFRSGSSAPTAASPRPGTSSYIGAPVPTSTGRRKSLKFLLYWVLRSAVCTF